MTIAALNKNLSEGIPEYMRVVNESGFYLVQSFSDTLEKWITQKEHTDRKAALTDLLNWY